MALTDTQKAQIRLYLGKPDNFRYKDTRLESVMDNVSPDAETQIASVLASLVTIEGLLTTAITIAAGGVKRVDEITFFDPINGKTIGFLNAQSAGKFFAGRLSIILGVPIENNAFGGSYGGDSFFPGLGRPINFG